MLLGSAATMLAFVLSLAIVAVVGTRHFDWVSPPIAACGLLGSLISVGLGCHPRRLARGMLLLNLLYWCYFGLLLASRR